MKFFRFGPLLALLGFLSTAQAPLIVASGGTVSLPNPPSSGKARLQLRVGSAVVDDETARVEGNVIVARLDVEPGLYQLRAVAGDKARAPLGSAVNVIVPGVRRDAGVWNFNGSSWVVKGTTTAPTTAFLDGLRRDDKRKLPIGIPVASNAPLHWETLPAPSLQSWLANGDVGALQTSWRAAQALGRVLVGYEMSVGPGDLTAVTRGQIREAITRFRAATKAWAPNAALVLSVDNRDALEAARQINLAAPFFDAIVLKWRAAPSFEAQLWPLKMARRTVEEQLNFDLPVWVDVSDISLSDAQLLELYQGGAMGFLAAPNEAKPAWVGGWERNSNWISGAVTLEDVALWPTRSPDLQRLAALLRSAGRVPLVGRLPGDAVGNDAKDENTSEKSAESLFVTLDQNTTAETIHAIERGATNGGTIYVEGLPSPALWDALGQATATTITALSAPKIETLTLDDPWVWGTIRGSELDVTQIVQITVKGSLAAKAREERGKANETQPRPIASLSDDPNGFMICPVGKGRVFWLPHRFRGAQEGQVGFYNAVAGTLQAALGTAFDAAKGVALPVRLTWRATLGKSSLLAIFNPTNSPLDVPVVGRGNDAYAVDLLTDAEVSTKVRGYETRLTVPVLAHGYAWIALGETKDIFNKERATTLVRARLK